MKADRNTFGFNVLGLVVIGLILFGVVTGLHAYGRWATDHEIATYENGIKAGTITDESTVVMTSVTDASGSRRVYYKLGHGAYANLLRQAGMGCRFYEHNGSPYRFEKFRTTDPIPFDVVRAGAWAIGECDASRFGDAFDLARAQQ